MSRRWGGADRRDGSYTSPKPPTTKELDENMTEITHFPNQQTLYNTHHHDPYTNWNGSGGGNYKPGPKCLGDHDGDRVLITFQNGTTVAGADKLGALMGHGEVILDLADAQPREIAFVKGSTEEAKKLNALLPPLPTIIRFDWPDATAPHRVPLRFWEQLPTLFPANTRIVIACIGGHGRTGTALAALCIAHLGYTADEAMAYVREAHCPRAIETLSQEKYLLKLETTREANTTEVSGKA